MLEEIKAKALREIIEGRAKPYLSTLHDYLVYVKRQVSAGEVNREYLFNILRDIGYLDMMGAELPEQPLEYIGTILTSEVPSTGENAPDLIDFEDLSYETETYIRQANNLLPPPQLNNITEEEAWEDMWRGARERGLGLILAGLDIIAIMVGHKLVLKESSKSVGWNNCWNDFEKNSEQYISELSKNKEAFYCLSDDIFSYLTKFSRMPECPFGSLLLEIAAPRETYVKENNYRWIISPEEAEEIFFKVSEKFEKYSSTAQVYFYENALAQEILKTFISRICFAKERKRTTHPGNWQFLTTLDEGFDCEVPMISAGGVNYSVHMLDTPDSRVSGWGMRKDRMNPFLPNDYQDFQGALFCSWKEYPTEEILVRFDNYIKKDRLKKLLRQKKAYFKEDFFKDYIMLTLDDVYKYPLRDQFLEEAAMAAMGLPIEEREQVAVLSTNEQEERERIRQAVFIASMTVLTMIMTLARRQAYFMAMRPAQALGATSPPPESNIIFVPRTFPPEGVKDETFFDPWSGGDLSSLVDLAGQREREWHFITFFMNPEEEIKLEKEEPERFTTGGMISKSVPAGTMLVGFVIGPEDKLIKVKNSFDRPGEVSDEEAKDIYWVFYGPGKDEEDAD